jgi:integrase
MADEIIHQPSAAAITPSSALTPAFEATLATWANATTDPDSPRRADLLRDKTNAVAWFFAYTGKAPATIQPDDVLRWQRQLEADGLATETIYAYISRISSFYRWALQDPAVRRHVRDNPVRYARPKKPKPYQSESVKALSDQELAALLAVVAAAFDHERADVRLIARRDYALLLFYVWSGRRRNEIIRLRWRDVTLYADGRVVFSAKMKGGVYETIEIADPAVQEALLDYLEYSGRLTHMQPDSPLWVAHDRARQTPAPATTTTSGSRKRPRDAEDMLTSHGFVKRLKMYAKAAGLEHLHLHQTRHTYARIVMEESGSIHAVQEALGHKSLAPTSYYVKRVAQKKDKFSPTIAARLKKIRSDDDASKS